MQDLTLDTFKRNLRSLTPDYKEKKYLLAISGGVDSMTVLHLFNSIQLKFEVAHINYNLRGEDSKRDEELVKNYCQENSISFHLKSIDTKKQKPSKVSLQMFCRELRYQFFEDIKLSKPYDLLVTAHHTDDSLETFFLKLNRGSGLSGLSGISAINSKVIRPLLAFSKEQVKNYAVKNNIKWREDSSNSESKYERNYIRNEVIPIINEKFPKFRENASKSISYLAEIDNFLEKYVEEQKTNYLFPFKSGIGINVEQVLQLPNFQILYYFRNYGLEDVKEIRKILSSSTGSYRDLGKFTAFKDRNILYILPKEEKESEQVEIQIDNLPCSLQEPFNLQIKMEEKVGGKYSLDAEKVKLPLKLRKRKQGDIFYPQGMKGRKKVSKFFKDEKIPNFEKENIWLLTDTNDDIISVLNYRLDNRFIPNKDTKQFINIYI